MPGSDVSQFQTFEGEISFESRQDWLRVQREARVELRSSLLVGGIAVSLKMTRATPGHLC